MTPRSESRLLGRWAGSVFFKAHLVPVFFILLFANSAWAQSTAVHPPSSESAAPGVDERLSPAQVTDLKTRLLAHEDWTKLSIKDLGLVASVPTTMPGTVDRPQFIRDIIRLQWRQNDPVDIYISLPKNVRKPRVVLYLYGYPNDASRFTADDWCASAVQGGFAAVGFVSALTGERYHAPRPIKSWFVSELQESLATSTHDVQMILNYLQTRDDLNTDRVAMYGQGSGATIAILAASVDPRIKVLDVLNPWGDWPDWLKQSQWVPDDERATYLQPEFLGKVANFDLLQVLPKLTTPVVRVQLIKDDRITPAAAREKIASGLPHGATLLESNSWPEYWKVFQEKNLWSWARQQLEPKPAGATISQNSR